MTKVERAMKASVLILLVEGNSELEVIFLYAGHVDHKFGPESFISEKNGKFSDVYKVLASIGEGGYGKVFKVEHKSSQIIRAMKSKPC